MNHPHSPDPDRRTVLKLAPVALAGGLDVFAGRVAADTPPVPWVEPKLDMKPAGAAVPRFGHMVASAYHTCKTCQSVEECKEWLAKAAGQKCNAAPEFCLNNELLAEFLFEPLMRKDR